MRTVRLFLWFCVGMLSFLVGSNWAYAETIPATNQSYPAKGWADCAARGSSWWVGCTAHGNRTREEAKAHAYQDALALCTGAGYATMTLYQDWGTNSYAGYTCSGGAGTGNNRTTLRIYATTPLCPDGGTYNAASGLCEGVSYTCPATGGWTLSGSTCTRPDCGPGTVRDETTGQCVASCPAAGSNPDVYLANQDNLTGCVNGCQYSRDNWPSGQSNQCWPVDLAGYSNNTNLAAYCQMAATGSACPAGATSSSGPYRKCKTGEAEMTINGVTTCTKAGATSSKTGSNTTTQNPDGSTSSESKSKTTTCDAAGNCTTTESTTNGNGTTTTTSQQDKVGFCEENPNSPLCREVEDECAENPDRLSCAEFGEVADPGGLTKQNGPLPTSLSPVSISENMSCPADIPLPKGLNFSWQGACDFASGIRPVVLAVAWLTAGLILVGAFRES